MTWIVIILSLSCVAALAYLTIHSAPTEKLPEDFYAELAKYVDGRLLDAEEDDETVRIKFTFENVSFLYEEIPVLSFREKTHKGFLKAQSQSDLNLYFTERKTSRIIQTGFEDVITQKDKQITLPQELRVFNAFSNHKDKADQILKDAKVGQIFLLYKNVDTSGYPFMPLKILNGEVILEFNSSRTLKPNLQSIRKNVPSIETYVDRVLLIVKKLNSIDEEIERAKKQKEF